MARLTSGSKNKTGFLLLFGLLLTTEVSTAAIENSNSVIVTTQDQGVNITQKNNVSLIQPQPNRLVKPITDIITKLGRLTGASMKQLDTALIWSTESLEKDESNTTTELHTPSPLLMYPQSFRTTVMQINQQLTKALRAINSNADRMALQLGSAPSYIDTLNRYLGQYPQKASLYANLLPLPLNGLKDLSEKSILLSNESSIELKQVANLTKAFGETAKAIYSAKVQYADSTLEEFVLISSRINEFEKEINSLNKERDQWSHNATELEKDFYTNLDLQLKKLLYEQNSENTSCVESNLKGWKNITDKLQVNACNENGLKTTKLENSTVQAVRKVKKEWTYALKNITKIEKTLTEKREANHRLSIDFQKLEHKKKRLDQDISLLFNTTKTIDELENDMEGLAVGWNNLATYCQKIQSDVATVRATLLSDSPTRDATRSVPNQEQLTAVNQQLRKIREDMNQIGKVAKSYVKAYDSNLSSLAAQLDQMMTISNQSPATLEENLINASTNASLKIDETQEITEQFQPLSQPLVD